MSDLIQTQFENRVLEFEKVIVSASFKLPISVSIWNLDPYAVERNLMKRVGMLELIREHNRHSVESCGGECSRFVNQEGYRFQNEVKQFLDDHIALIAEMKMERERGRR